MSSALNPVPAAREVQRDSARAGAHVEDRLAQPGAGTVASASSRHSGRSAL